MRNPLRPVRAFLLYLWHLVLLALGHSARPAPPRNHVRVLTPSGQLLEVRADAAGGTFQPIAKGVFRIRAQADGAAEVLIYGPIGEGFWEEGVTAVALVQQLQSLQASTLNVRINSDGGLVSDGIAIYNALKAHPARKVVTIDYMAASIASVVAMAGDEVVMPANTMMMVHAPRASLYDATSAAMRDAAAAVDQVADALATSYAAKTRRPAAEFRAIFDSGRDHYYSAEEAVAMGLADRVLALGAVEPEEADPSAAPDDQVAVAALATYTHCLQRAPDQVAAQLRARLTQSAGARGCNAIACMSQAAQRAVLAQIEDPEMLQQLQLIVHANAAGGGAGAAGNRTTTTTPAGVGTAAGAGTAGAPVDVQAAVRQALADERAAIAARNGRLTGVFARARHMQGVAEIEHACLADPTITIEAAQQRLLNHLGAGAVPLAGNGSGSVTAGQDERDRQVEAATSALMARGALLPTAEADRARQGNPYAGRSLLHLAEMFLQRAGVNTRFMDRQQLARAALRPTNAQGTSDFPVLMEATLNRVVRAGFARAAFTWRRFCAVGTLTDFRPHYRYDLSSFADLKDVNEHGEYEDGSLGDAEKQEISGKRKGRILSLTPEVLINDDMQALTRLPLTLGTAAGRTVEKGVYVTLALNSGLGPVLTDTKTLFHADHGNIDTTVALPTIASFSAARQLMGQQKDPGDQDFLDLVPAIWLGPQALRDAAIVVNSSEFDHSGSALQKPNTSRNMVRDVVDTPRLTGTRWYMLADPEVEPVLEVAFFEGQQNPVLAQEENFRTAGLSWRIELPFGVGGVGYRGATTNAGS